MRRKKIRIVSYFIVLGALFAVTYFVMRSGEIGAVESRRKEQLSAMLELSEYSANLQPAMEKAAIISSPALFSEQMGIIVENSACARQALDVLTDAAENYTDLYRIFRQIGDFALYLQKNLSSGRDIPVNQRKNLQELSLFISSLNKQLSLLSSSVLTGERSLDNAENLLNKTQIPLLDDDLPEIVKMMEGLPKLIYDGPFSDALNETEPDKSAWISKDKASELAAKFLGVDVIVLRELSEQEEPYPAYCWYFGKKSVKISKKIAAVSEFMQALHVGEALVEDDDAKKIAASYLKKLGFSNMLYVSSRDADGVRCFEFACTSKGVVIYSDAIKVNVAMDSGEVVGFDAAAYVMNHKERELASATLSAQAATTLLPDVIKASESPRLALIKKQDREILCWEFECKITDSGKTKSVNANLSAKPRSEYLVYLNANSGVQEDVLLLNRNGGELWAN